MGWTGKAKNEKRESEFLMRPKSCGMENEEGGGLKNMAQPGRQLGLEEKT